MKVFGQAALAKFVKKHAQARKPIDRFLAIAHAAVWPHFPALRQTFSAADYAPSTGVVVFDLGGNKYRVTAVVNFEKQAMFIQRVMTHEEYNRENL